MTEHLSRDLVAALMQRKPKPASPPGQEPTPTNPSTSDKPTFDEDDVPIGDDPDYPEAVAYEGWHANENWSIKAPENWA
ncbi:hypothetical protein [Nocardia otitidiscaviarum]|uniref:Uncharacterized protein n=1 Tax=Nocardia otitidiscaviarum TaxID=1823 RepID=A0A516NQX3_9NOCA|nr:hypothetical protein [Nocardia otitidiscaviarum]MBF6181757.1 hypothetical protein [Nocardia otitidiscaviarum]MCP9620461.1 hypothetical protein [Nocardia otitidiscaviarum]QDP81298.1 hypothetical protein FOH10_23845 [Nocardia otitidiscaviarum]